MDDAFYTVQMHKFVHQYRRLASAIPLDFHSTPNVLQECFELIKLLIVDKLAKDGPVKVNHQYAADLFTVRVEVSFVTAPKMWDVRSEEGQVATIERLHRIADEFGARAFYHQEKLVFGMGMPRGVEMPVVQLPDKEDV